MACEVGLRFVKRPDVRRDKMPEGMREQIQEQDGTRAQRGAAYGRPRRGV